MDVKYKPKLTSAALLQHYGDIMDALWRLYYDDKRTPKVIQVNKGGKD
ncbi:hypothetical protein [Shewanella gaetbuli]